MEESTMHFDSSLGGCHHLPNACKLSDFIKDRLEEVLMLTKTIGESPFRGQTFQRLPKHMRRRQMSHYIKRLPRRLQRPYMTTLKEGLPEPSKCPSRKYRRRPNNLLLEYNRRQKEFVWLETHIWHAKRFHMAKKWGYKLPEKPTNKGYRACYRALSEHCLVTDISYYNCIELKGSEKELLEGLMQCTSTDCNLTFAAKMYLLGTREGSVTLFHPNSYPNQAIGNITFFWKPVNDGEETRQIWIWVHPLMHNEIVDCFKNLFNLTAVNEISVATVASENVQEKEIEISAEPKRKVQRGKKKGKFLKKRIEQIKLEPKNVPFSRTPKYINESQSICMTLLKDTLNRFQLVGPLSQAIISQAFNIIHVSPMDYQTKLPKGENSGEEEVIVVECKCKRRKLNDDSMVVKENEETKMVPDEKMDVVIVEEEKKWWEKYYKDEIYISNWTHQRDFYQRLSDCTKPTDVPPGLILSLVIGDPRLKIPSRREKAISKSDEPRQILENSHETNLSASPIWDSEIRDEVSMTKLTTQEINEFRSKKIVPGFDVEDVVPNSRQSRIPILLVQRPGVREGKKRRLGLGSGWDIISPAGYGLPLWLALIFRGARSGGLRETELLQLECGNMNNYLQPDTAAGKNDSERRYQELRSRHFKLPPNKRPNHIKLGVPCPFRCPWNLLVSDWIDRIGPDAGKGENQGFKVLRSRKCLRELSRMNENPSKLNLIELDDLAKSIGSDFLVPVSIELAGRGKPMEMASICLPNETDLKESEPSESSRFDENEKSRKSMKTMHSKVLKSMKRKRRRERVKTKEKFANDLANRATNLKDILKNDTATSERIAKEHKSKMESLWMPTDSGKIVDFPTRKIIGFVVKGDFTFSKSISTALGYVAILGLIESMKNSMENNSKSKVLIRNQNQTQYRFGTMRIIEE